RMQKLGYSAVPQKWEPVLGPGAPEIPKLVQYLIAKPHAPMAPRALKPEFLAKVKAAYIRIVDDLFRTALSQDLPGIDDIGAVGQPQRFAHIVVGDQDADTAVGEVADQVLDVADRDRIDAGKGFVEQHVVRTRRQRARDFDAAALAARERDRRRFAQPRDVEFIEQRIEFGLALLATGLDHLEHGANILLHREAAKDRGFLRQIADAESRALIHRQLGDVVAVQFDGATIRLDQASDHVEHGGLAGAVRTKQADRLATADIDADAAHHLPRAETFFHAVHGEEAGPLGRARRFAAIGLGTGLLRTGTRSVIARRLCGGLRLRQFQPGQRSRARHRRRVAYRVRQHVAEGIAECGDVVARTRK